MTHVEHDLHPHADHDAVPTRSLLLVVLGLAAVGAVIFLTTAPLGKVLETKHEAHVVPVAAHGMMAFLFIITATIGAYLGFRLFIGKIQALHDLQILATAMATISAMTVFFGNWIYIYYRDPNPDSPRSWLMKNAPEVHKIFFEFKEFMALFTLPLAVAGAWILWHYGAQVLKDARLRYGVSIVFFLIFFYLAVTFGLGAAVARIRPL